MRLGKLGTSFSFARKRKSNIGLPLPAAGAHASLGGIPERHAQVFGKRREVAYPSPSK